MRIGFYHPLSGNTNTDIGKVYSGNPGYGGTQFCFSLVICYLAKRYENLEIIVYSDVILKLPPRCVCKIVISNEELLKSAEEDNVRFLIVKTPLEIEFYHTTLNNYRVNIICWSHNYFNSHIAKAISSNNHVKSVVFVSKQMYDFYYDHDIIKKSTYIYNPVPDHQTPSERNYSPYTVVYMGSIIREKGILELLELWNIIENKYPQAVLYVIGSGCLYDSRIKLGEFGITEEGLEKQMFPLMCNEDGTIKGSIHFVGVLGEEKYAFFSNAAVGIVNPSAKTETFGMGIIEMASSKLPVVTKCWNGHLDTIVNEVTGLTAFTIRGMAKQIFRLFEDKKLNKTLGENAKQRVGLFDPVKIAESWYCHISCLANEERNKIYKISPPFWNNYKIIRVINSFLRFRLHLLFLPSVVVIETLINDMTKRIKSYTN